MDILTPRLRVRGLRLRAARPDDLDGLHEILSMPEAMRYWSTPPHETLDETKAWLASMMASTPDISADYIIEHNGVLIGKVGFFRLPELGYILHPRAWGQGFAREAVTAVLDHVFDKGIVEQVIAESDPANDGSIRVLTSLGFVQTGAAKATIMIGGVWCDSVYFALERSDWAKRAGDRGANAMPKGEA